MEKPKAISQGDFRIDTDAWYLAWFSSRRVLFFQLTSAPTFCGFYCASQVKVHLSPSNKLFTFEVVCCKTVAPWRFSGRFFLGVFVTYGKMMKDVASRAGDPFKRGRRQIAQAFTCIFPSPLPTSDLSHSFRIRVAFEVKSATSRCCRKCSEKAKSVASRLNQDVAEAAKKKLRE